MDITWIQPYYHIILGYIPETPKTILDVGAGYGIFGYIIKKTRNTQLTAIEPFYDDLPHDLVFKMTWKEWYEKHKTHYDVLIATEMIEHLPEDEALLFLKQAKETADVVVIATPLKFEEQKAYDNNEYQKHLCAVSKEQFMEEGYSIFLYNDSIIASWKK